MKVKRHKRTKNELGGVHVKEFIKEVPDPVDYSKKAHSKLMELKDDIDDRLDDLKERQKKIAEKVGATE